MEKQVVSLRVTDMCVVERGVRLVSCIIPVQVIDEPSDRAQQSNVSLLAFVRQ